MIPKQPFNSSILRRADDIPDELLEDMSRLVNLLLAHATIKNAAGAIIRGEEPDYHNFNVSLGAVQKVLGLLIQEFFKGEYVNEAVEQTCIALRATIKEGYKFSD